MESKQLTRQGANRRKWFWAIWYIGQDLQRRRWAVLAHPRFFWQRPVFQVFWTSLRPDCGQSDHCTGRALPANPKNRSNEPYWVRHALERVRFKWNHLMEENRFTRPGAVRSAMPSHRASAATTPMGRFPPPLRGLSC